MKKRIDIKKALIIMGMIVILVIAGFFIASQLTKPKEKQEIKQPVAEEQDDYENSLLSRNRGEDRTGLFNYTIAPKVKKTEKYISRFEWAKNMSPDYSGDIIFDLSNADLVKLDDGSELFIDGLLALNKYDVSYVDNKIVVKNDDYKYGYEIIKINNDDYKCIDFYDYDNEATAEYQKIKENYENTYSVSDKSMLEADGLNTYEKMVEFVKKHGVEKDVYLYTADQIKGVVERAFGVTLDGFTTLFLSEANEGYVTSNALSKTEQLNGDEIYGSSKYEAYFLQGNGKDIYAVHFYRTSQNAEDSTLDNTDYMKLIYPFG